MSRALSTWLFLGVLCAPGVSRADDNHEVINVVNNLVYVDLGTRDGAEVGDEIEVMSDGAPLGKIELDLCGEVVCRGKLPKSLSTRVHRGMSVRLASGPTPVSPSPKTTSPPANAKPVPTPEPPSFDSPERLSYREPIPHGYRVSRQRLSTAVTLGWIGLGASYGLSFFAGTAGEPALLIPIVGPFIQSAKDNGGSGYILLGIGQAVSVVFLIAGYAGERVLIRSDKVTISLGGNGVIGRF